jgi:hypothetical protein
LLSSGFQVAGVFGRQRDVAPAIGPEAFKDRMVVIAVRARVHCITRPSSTLILAISISIWPVNSRTSSGWRGLPGPAGNTASASAQDSSRRKRRLGRVIGGAGAHLLEELPAVARGLDVAA